MVSIPTAKAGGIRRVFLMKTGTEQMRDEYLESLRRGNISERACMLILDDNVDGAHHKQWQLDQVLRMLAGERYRTLVMVWEQQTGGEWDTGIAP